ncbi:hypothetical protein AAC387_Pa12g2382 [Persea americana]
MIISGNDTIGIADLKTHLMRSFQMKDLGALTYFLGLEISRGKEGIRVNQTKYADDLIGTTRLQDAKTFDTPLELNVKISKDDGCLLEDPTLFRRLVWSLLYLTMTRPDISHAVHTVSQFVNNPHKPHLAAVYRFLRYLKGTQNRGLFYPSKTSLRLQAYAMQIGLVVSILVAPPQAGVCFLDTPSSHGNAKSKLHYPNLQRRLNIVLCLQQAVKLFGSVAYSVSLEFLSPPQLLSMLTTQVPSGLLKYSLP